MTPHTALGCLLATLLLAGSGCGFPSQDGAEPLAEDELPVGLRPSATPEPAHSEGAVQATIWLVDGDRLVSVRHEVPSPASAETITEALLDGPTSSEQQRGIRSALPDPAVAVGATSSRGVATVELNESFTEIAPEDQLLAVGQFVLTLTDAPGVGTVTFQIDGEPAAVPLPTGESSDGPVFREQYLDLRD
jgi:spore germination protein GerM